MISVNSTYKQACSANNRVSYVVAKYGLYNKEAKGKIDNIIGTKQSFSNANKLYNEVKDIDLTYISCEPNRVKLNNKFCFIFDKNKTNSNENIAYWSKEISNYEGFFISNPKLTIIMNQEIDFSELTLYFQEVCSFFTVFYYYNDSLIEKRNIVNNKYLVVTTNGVNTLTNLKFNKIEIEFIKTIEPFRYIKLNEIDFGSVNKFSSNQILDFNIIDELSIDGSELSSNSLNLTLKNENGEFDILNPRNKLNMLQEKQEISMYYYLRVGGTFKELPLGTFLLKKISNNNTRITIEAYDDTYFMNKLYYGSKFYDNVEITTILNDLFTYFNYTKYSIDKELVGIKLTGYIPIVEMREALRLITEAGGCVVSKTRYGTTNIFKTYDPQIKTFNRREIFSENHKKNLFNNTIDINEYNYSDRKTNYLVYENTLDVGKHFIEFNEYPILQETLVKADTSNNDFTILGSYATSCLIEVKVKTKVILKATLIKVTSTTQRRLKGINPNMEIDNYAIDKVDNTLITKDNSTIIAQWKLGRGEVKYIFDTPVAPYIEVGDTCKYETKYNYKNDFVVTRIEFDNGIIQNVEGE